MPLRTTIYLNDETVALLGAYDNLSTHLTQMIQEYCAVHADDANPDPLSNAEQAAASAIGMLRTTLSDADAVQGIILLKLIDDAAHLRNGIATLRSALKA